MESFGKKLNDLDHITSVEYVFDGKPNSSWGTITILVFVDSETDSIENTILSQYLQEMYESDQLKKDLKDQGAVEYNVTFRYVDSDENIYGLTAVDNGNDSFDTWRTSDGGTLLVCENGIEISYPNTEETRFIEFACSFDDN